MALDPNIRPIIIKKIKKGGHAHHGGAWKVAYADFVTAMMAFFLMLWLLSSVDEAKLEGLAEYFTPTVGLRDSMGIGFEGGETVNMDGIKKSDKSPPGIVTAPPPGQTDNDNDKKAVIEAEKDAQLFEKAEEALKKAFESDPNLRDMADNIIVEQSPEGLKIEIMDSDKHPMFDPGSAILSEYGSRILAKMSRVIKDVPNFISLTGHTDASPMTSRGTGYTNWELSADRANAARRFLLQVGMDPERPKKVIGQASSDLLLPDQPLSPRNRRITIILLHGSYMELRENDLPATRELLSVPVPSTKRSDAVREENTKLKQQEIQRRQQELLKAAPISTTSPGTQTPPNAPPTAIDALTPATSAPAGVGPATTPSADVNKTTAPDPIRERDPSDFKPFVDENTPKP